MHSRTWHTLTWLTLFLGLLCWGAGPRVLAAPTRGDASDEHLAARPSSDRASLAPLVFLAPMDRERESRDLAQAVSSQLSDLRVRLVLYWAAPASDTLDAWLKEARRAGKNARALAVFWTSQRRLHLFFGRHQETQLLIRDLGVVEGSERAEALSLILRTALSAYQRGARFPSPPGVLSPGRPSPEKTPAGHGNPLQEDPSRGTPQRAEPSQRTPRQAEHSPALPRLTLELGYVLTTWSRVQPAHHGASAALSWQVMRQLALRVGTRWTSDLILPSLAEEDPVYARLTRFPVFASARGQLVQGRFILGMEATVQVEYLRMRLGPANLVRMGEDRGDFRWALEPALFSSVRLLGRLRLFLRLSAEIILRFQQFGYRNAQGELISFGREWPVKPRAELGLTADLW